MGTIGTSSYGVLPFFNYRLVSEITWRVSYYKSPLSDHGNDIEHGVRQEILKFADKWSRYSRSPCHDPKEIIPMIEFQYFLPDPF